MPNVGKKKEIQNKNSSALPDTMLVLAINQAMIVASGTDINCTMNVTRSVFMIADAMPGSLQALFHASKEYELSTCKLFASKIIMGKKTLNIRNIKNMVMTIFSCRFS